MSKDRTITNGKLPDRVCPHCGGQVVKTVRYGQLSYECLRPCSNWGPWDEAHRKSVPQKGVEHGA